AFADLYLENGLPLFGDKTACSGGVCLGSPLRAWGGFQIFGTTAAATDLANAEISPTAVSSVDASKFSTVVEQVGAEGGLAYRIAAPDHDSVGIPRDEPSRTAVELLFKYAIKSTFSFLPVSSNQKVFCTNCDSSGGLPSPSETPAYLVFTAPQRRRMLNAWGTGLRLQTFFVGGDHLVQPSQFDFTFGQDEAVTAGYMHGFTASVSGFMPLPKADFVSIFFTADWALPSHNSGFALPTNGFFEEKCTPMAPATTCDDQLPSNTPRSEVTQLLFRWPNTDTMSVGVALDMIDFLKNHLKFK